MSNQCPTLPFIFWIVLLFFLSSISTEAKEIRHKFVSLDVEDGLSQNDVNTILQDHRRFVWFGTSNKITFNNLVGGKSTFRTIGSSNDQIWNESGVPVPLYVHSPLWKTWWAYSLYLLTFLGLLLIGIRFGLKSKEQKLKRQENKLRQGRDALVHQTKITQELERINRLKDDFLANTSHELLTPINGMIGLVESLIEYQVIQQHPEITLDLSIINRNSRHLANLVQGILDFSRLKNQDLVLQQKTIDLTQLVEIVLRLCAPLINSKDLKLLNQVEEGVFVFADEEYLHQIFYNLIGNAIKFTLTGSVRISAQKESSKIKIYIKDTGIGIPEDQLENIFHPFQQAEESMARKYEGVGLGLNITRNLVELHGGVIEVQSLPGIGSEFNFTLPQSESPPNCQATQTAVNARKNTIPSPPEVQIPLSPIIGKGASLLVVDDDLTNLKVIANYLTSQDYFVEFALSGKEALAQIEQGKIPDLILLDIMMPELSGYQVCQYLRKTYSPAQLPIVFLTAKTQTSDLMDAFDVGANDYLYKPIFKGELLSRLNFHFQFSLSVKRMISLRQFTEQAYKMKRREQIMLSAFSFIHSLLEMDIAALFCEERLIQMMPEKDASCFADDILLFKDELKANEITRKTIENEKDLLFLKVEEYLMIFCRNHEREKFSESEEEYVRVFLRELMVLQKNLFILTYEEQPQLFQKILSLKNDSNQMLYLKREDAETKVIYQNMEEELLFRISLENLQVFFPNLERVHRSYLVNPHYITRVVFRKNSRNTKEYKVYFTNGIQHQVSIGVSYLSKVKRKYPQWF